MKLRYMIIGAGGVGGPVGAYLSKSGADTTLIARGKHLAVLQEHGLTLVSGENERESIPVKAIDIDGFLRGTGTGSCGPDVLPQYTVDGRKELAYSFVIVPIK